MSLSSKPANPVPLDTVPKTSIEQPEQTSPSVPGWRLQLVEIGSRVIMPFLITRILLVVVGLLTIYYILPLINRKQPIVPDPRLTHFPDMLYLMWAHFDSGFFLGIAEGGYWNADSLLHMSNWAFFPLYPLFMRLFALLLGGNGISYISAGIIVSNLSALVAAAYLYKLTTRELNKTIATRAVWYMLLFPMSFYLSAVYSESLFLALSISCIYYARMHRWWLAGVLGGLAALTRIQGVLLVLAVAWEYWQFLADRFAPTQEQSGRVASVQNWCYSRLIGFWRSLASWRTWLDLASLTLIPLGLCTFCLYSKWKVGRFLAFWEVEKNGWGRQYTNPIELFLYMLQHPAAASPYEWNFYTLNMLVIVVFWSLLILILRKLPFIYSILTFVYLVIPLVSGRIGSVARFYLITFPIYMILAWWSAQGNQEYSWRHNFICSTFAILLGVGMVLFTLGVYSIA
jgi:Mannosyltransferase (PIG-V)